MYLKSLFFALVGSLTLLISGCGGESNSTKLATGYFVDAGVKGLFYISGSTSGYTDTGGKFSYVPGTSVEFFLYGQPLSGSGLTSEITTLIVTPFDIDLNRYHPAFPINVMRLLLALDLDQNPANGIELPSHSGSFSINFNISLQAFEADSDGKIKSFLAAYAKGRPLYPLKGTVEHFSNTIATVGPSTGYSLSFQGKTAKSVIENSACTNVKGGWVYTFGSQSFTMKGVDSFNRSGGSSDCTLGNPETLNYPYPTSPTNEFLGCLPKCAYNEINRISWIESDEDGRTAVEYSWHSPSKNKIFYVKQIVEDKKNNNHPDSLSYFIETITID